MVILEIYIFQSPVKMTTQSKPLPFVTEQTTQLYVSNWVTTQPKQHNLYSLYKIILQHVVKYIFYFLSFVNHRKESTTQKNPYKLKAKLRANAQHYASEQFVNKEAITECNSRLYAAAGEMDRWGWMVAVWGVSLWMSCACHCEEVHKYRSRQWLLYMKAGT